MSEHTTNWTKEEFLTYLYIFCSNADFVESEDELRKVKEHMPEEVYHKMHKEYGADSDYSSIEKIRNTYERLEYSSEDREELFQKIKDIFNADGKFDILEKNMLMSLNRILS